MYTCDQHLTPGMSKTPTGKMTVRRVVGIIVLSIPVLCVVSGLALVLILDAVRFVDLGPSQEQLAINAFNRGLRHANNGEFEKAISIFVCFVILEHVPYFEIGKEVEVRAHNFRAVCERHGDKVLNPPPPLLNPVMLYLVYYSFLNFIIII